VKTDAGSARSRARTLPRRRKTSFAARIKPFWIFLIVLVVVAGWSGAWLLQSPWFRVTRIAVDVPLASPVSSNAVRAAAGISRENNVWLIDTRAAARRIDAIPYVQSATIRRAQFPKPVVELAITVRRPSACVRGGGRDVTIDATARVLQTACASPALPRIEAGTAVVPAPGGTIVFFSMATSFPAAALSADGGKASWLWLTAYFVVITIGELYLSPVSLSLVTKVAPARAVSMMMGVWLATSFIGNFLAGYLGSFWSSMDKGSFFLMIAVIAALAGLVILATGWFWLDPVASLLIVAVIVWRVYESRKDKREEQEYQSEHPA